MTLKIAHFSTLIVIRTEITFMQTLRFSCLIKSQVEKVWSCLWESENYQEWTDIFFVNSYHKTDQFAEGHRIQLLSPIGEGRYCILEKVEPFKLLVFRNIGEIKNFQEEVLEQRSSSSSVARESYKLCAAPEVLELVVEIDTLLADVPKMSSIFPAALQVLSRIAEPKDEDSYLCATAEVFPLPYRCTFLKTAPN